MKFISVLRKHKHEHPLIYLTEVKFADLQSILDFIYTGETEVAERDLESLLATATRFKVKGLTDGLGANEALSTVPSGAGTVTLGSSPEAVKRRMKTDPTMDDKRPKIVSPTVSALKTTITPMFPATDPTIIKSEHNEVSAGSLVPVDHSSLPRAVRTSATAEPIDISSFLSPEEQQQFESEAVVSHNYPKTVSNVIDTASVSQNYLDNKTELDRQCNELMVSSYDSALGG